MNNLPIYISLLFGLTTLLAIIGFYASIKSKKALVLIFLWTLIQTGLGLSGVYQDTTAMPPRIMLFGIFPAFVMVLLAVFSKRTKALVDQIDLRMLTYFHTIRIPVEVILSLLFHFGVMSVYITYEGTNFDLISGITAPLFAFVAFRGATVNKRLLLAWNILGLMLLLNVVITAIFAFPSPFQKLAFEQPNLAVLYYPFNLLPTVVVPLVLFGHLAAIKRLVKND